MTNARMLVALPLLSLLTACSVNAPVTNDIHDNYVEIPNMTVNTPDWKNSVPNPMPSNPLADIDPNAKQDIPDPWGEDDVYESSYCELNPTDSACVVSTPNP